MTDSRLDSIAWSLSLFLKNSKSCKPALCVRIGPLWLSNGVVEHRIPSISSISPLLGSERREGSGFASSAFLCGCSLCMLRSGWQAVCSCVTREIVAVQQVAVERASATPSEYAEEDDTHEGAPMVLRCIIQFANAGISPASLSCGGPLRL